MDRIMVEICRSSPVENWVTAVNLSSNWALVARFSKSLMKSWNLSFGVPSSSFPVGFILGFELAVLQFVVPFFRESNAFPSAHLTKDQGELEFIGVVYAGID